jgi:hypothetical protein
MIENNMLEEPPPSYTKINFVPISVDTHRLLGEEPPPTGTHTISAAENLTIEDVSGLIKADTFSLWKAGCHISKDMADALDRIGFAIVHRFPSSSERGGELQQRSTELLNIVVGCLSLIRPTRRSHATSVHGVIRADGSFDAHGFSGNNDLADVPEIQKLFMVSKNDMNILSRVLPEFVVLYQKDSEGKVRDEYEPLRMAVQLYEQAYAISYWKARHILWWSAIEALYGSNEDAAKARIYALFGEKNLVDGYRCVIYETGDIPSCWYPSPSSLHTLGKMVPLIYEVRNASAHGQRVSDSHFRRVAHPFGETSGIDALAEAATFVIRKTVIRILERGLRDKFRDRDTREAFWLYEYGLDKHQSKKRLREMYEVLGTTLTGQKTASL